MKNYTITVSEQQAQVLSQACEILSRLGIGQFRDALEKLPTTEFMPEGWHEAMDQIGDILRQFTVGNVDGWRSSLGVHHEKVGEEAKLAWELHQAIRHRLSWDRAKAAGLTDGTTRNWADGMMGVNYDEPFPVTGKPMAKIESASAPGAITWTLVRESVPTVSGRYLVTVETDEGLEVHTLYFKVDELHWIYEGEPTFCGSFLFNPVAWAQLPPAASSPDKEKVNDDQN